MKRICALPLLVLGCAHEKLELVAAAIGCPEERVVKIAEADARDLRHPRQPTTQETATNAGAAALGALANATLGHAPASAQAFYLPANGVRVMAPGWRQYDGCDKALVCFDGGFCMKAEEAEAAALARRVPSLMVKSALEDVAPKDCTEPATAERQGLLSWAVTRCDRLRVCTAEKGGAYACNGEEQPGR